MALRGGDLLNYANFVLYDSLTNKPVAKLSQNMQNTLAEWKEKGYEVLVAKMPVEAIPRAKQIGKADGFIKIVIDKKSNKILGASMICENSSEIIHLIQLAVDLEVEYTYLRDRVYAHPTMTEALNDILSPNMIKEV